jgi:hypothetical protein
VQRDAEARALKSLRQNGGMDNPQNEAELAYAIYRRARSAPEMAHPFPLTRTLTQRATGRYAPGAARGGTGRRSSSRGRMMWSWGKTEPERFPGMSLCFVDREANKYTTAVAASDGDWWLGARILMLRDFERMRREGTNVVLMDIQIPGPDVKPWATATSTSISHAVMSSAQSRGCRLTPDPQ